MRHHCSGSQSFKLIQWQYMNVWKTKYLICTCQYFHSTTCWWSNAWWNHPSLQFPLALWCILASFSLLFVSTMCMCSVCNYHEPQREWLFRCQQNDCAWMKTYYYYSVWRCGQLAIESSFYSLSQFPQEVEILSMQVQVKLLKYSIWKAQTFLNSKPNLQRLIGQTLTVLLLNWKVGQRVRPTCQLHTHRHRHRGGVQKRVEYDLEWQTELWLTGCSICSNYI